MALSEFAFTEGVQRLSKLLYMRNDNYAYKFLYVFRNNFANVLFGM